MSGLSGLPEPGLTELREILRAVLAGAAPVKVYLFGSRARGDNQKYSDADLLVKGPIDERLLRELRDALAQSALPFKCDVVPEAEVFPAYHGQIESEKELVFDSAVLPR